MHVIITVIKIQHYSIAVKIFTLSFSNFLGSSGIHRDVWEVRTRSSDFQFSQHCLFHKPSCWYWLEILLFGSSYVITNPTSSGLRAIAPSCWATLPSKNWVLAAVGFDCYALRNNRAYIRGLGHLIILLVWNYGLFSWKFIPGSHLDNWESYTQWGLPSRIPHLKNSEGLLCGIRVTKL